MTLLQNFYFTCNHELNRNKNEKSLPLKVLQILQNFSDRGYM